MLKTLSAVLAIGAAVTIWCGGCQTQRAMQAIPDITPSMSATALRQHPAAPALARLFPETSEKPSGKFKTTGIKRLDYLTLVAGNVDFYKQHQNADGAIIDPVKHEEIQYSTPAFALSCATLVVQKKRDDLLDPAVRAMTFATHALANHTTANFHADFYIPMLMHTRRILKDRVPPETLAKWDADFRSIVPEKNYRDIHAGGNWNLVQPRDGENLRRKGRTFVATTQMSAQADYIEKSLDKQQARFTKFGMYADPNMPLAYDAFPRLWMDDMMADGAYQGPHAQQIRDFHMLGGLSSLLMISPTGEWAIGGRSAQHQWNEAENIVIFEINARKWRDLGREDIAGAMKRSAHLAYQSMLRWQRPSGEMWIVKNRAEPETRLGYEGYSSHSQYNLLPMAMLCIAFERADDSIAERPAPCETGGFVFDVREKFHKVFANAGGMYIEIDTAADPEYNATGLQRVERKGVPFSPLSDSSAAKRGYGTANKAKEAIAPGIQWNDSPPTTQPTWRGLADYVNPTEPKPTKGEKVVQSVDLDVANESPDNVAFTLQYHLGDGDRAVQEQYEVHPDEVVGSWQLAGFSPGAKRVIFPVLVNNGREDLSVQLDHGILEAHREGCVLRWIPAAGDNQINLRLSGPVVENHNGFVRAVIGDFPAAAREIDWRLTLENEK